MKIGVVCYPTYGGSGVVATELGKGLARMGHEVHFVSYSQPFRMDLFTENLYYHEAAPSNYPLFVYPPYLLSLAGKLVDVVKHNKLDVLHVHYAIPHATAAQLAQAALRQQGIEIPVVTTLHGTDINLVGTDESYRPIVKLAIDSSNKVTAVSESLKGNTIQNFGIERHIDVIPNFIDLERFRVQPKDHFKKAIAPNNEPICIHVSNFRELKRVDHVIDIFMKVRSKIDCKLLLVGDGPDRAKIEKKCRESSYCADVRFLGKQDAIEEILAVSDLFIMPSESESFGLAALEAMACGVPVISSNAGGIPELNVHGETGFVHDIGDVDAMAKSALELLSEPTKLAEFKTSAEKRAERFDLDVIAPLYLKSYEEAIAESSLV